MPEPQPEDFVGAGESGDRLALIEVSDDMVNETGVFRAHAETADDRAFEAEEDRDRQDAPVTAWEVSASNAYAPISSPQSPYAHIRS
jgi:hypothetical protein